MFDVSLSHGEFRGHRQMPWRDQLSEINQQSAPTLVSRQASVSEDSIVESRSAQYRPSQEEGHHTVEVLVSKDQHADFYYKHLGGTDKDTIGHQPPEPENQTPGRDQLSGINQQLAPTFSLASRQASVPQDPIVESRAATTETQGEMSYGGASKLGPAVDAAGGQHQNESIKEI